MVRVSDLGLRCTLSRWKGTDVFDDPGEADVGDLGSPLPAEQDVVALQVEVHHAAGVQKVQPAGDVQRDVTAAAAPLEHLPGTGVGQRLEQVATLS